jgi:hypothetical protein
MKCMGMFLVCVSSVISLRCSQEKFTQRMREPTEENRIDLLPSIASKLQIKSKFQVLNDNEENLLQWVEELKMEKVKMYEGGAYGKVGSTTMFIADKRVIPDFDRLYWVMVKVLSEKYGCFMKRKHAEEKTVTVNCRDKRTIVFKRHEGSDWIQFYGKQFDIAGNELIVRR